MAEEQPMLDFIFYRELSEVYLLLDNVSMSSDKTLQGPNGGTAPSGDEDWIEQICEIGWPPKGSTAEQAAQATTLIKAKDRLNRLASPATGLTIAFTLLVVGDDDPDRQGGLFKWIGSLFRPARRRANAAAKPATEDQEAHTAEHAASLRHRSRTSLARQAFPGLIARAKEFRASIQFFIVALFFWLVLTCALSWNIAIGNAALGQLTALANAKADILKQISNAEAGTSNPATDASQGPGGGAPPAGKAAPKGPTIRYCDRPRLLPPVFDQAHQTIDRFDNTTELQVCDALDANSKQHAAAEANLKGWLGSWSLITKVFGPQAAPSEPSDPSQTTEQWAYNLAAVLGGNVLPVFYGILGAGAAVVRSLSRKMSNSLLSPRDHMLSWVQLGLGAVIGACIGLFVPTPGGSGQGATGLLGPIALSSSALCFIAGFGVEGVFAALEGLINRVFNVGETSKTPA